MVTAIVLINCDKGMVSQAAEGLGDVEGISEVYSVAGRVDLVAIIRVKNDEALADIVTTKLQFVSGIERTETLICFHVFSKYDLERMFSIDKGP